MKAKKSTHSSKASAQPLHPVEQLAMLTSLPLAPDEDNVSPESQLPWQELAARSVFKNGQAKSLEEARRLVEEAI